MNVVVEELKQRITAIAAKIRRYQGRVDSYKKDTKWLQDLRSEVNVKK